MILMGLVGQSVCAEAEDPISGIAETAAALPIKRRREMAFIVSSGRCGFEPAFRRSVDEFTA
jgi:hypothetical protein